MPITKTCLLVFFQCRTKRERMSCGLQIGGVLIATLLLVLCTMGLIMGFSYAINSKIYNMTTGKVLPDLNVTSVTGPLTFYAHSDLAILLGWALLLAFIECVLFVCLRFLYNTIHTKYDMMVNSKYLLVEELPRVPDTQFDSVSDSL